MEIFSTNPSLQNKKTHAEAWVFAQVQPDLIKAACDMAIRCVD